MDSKEAALSGIRIVESGGQYGYQRAVKVGGTRDRKVGAYGVLESKWPVIAETLGYQGADWRDPQVQDTLVGELLEMHYRELGSWELAAVAIRFGGKAARGLKNKGYIEPQSVSQAGFSGIADHMRALRSSTPQLDSPVIGEMPQKGTESLGTNPSRVKAESVVRNQVLAMRDSQRKSMAAEAETELAAEEEVLDGGDSGVQQG